MAAYYMKAWQLWATHRMRRFEAEYSNGSGHKQQALLTELLAVRIRFFGNILRELVPGASLDCPDLRAVMCRTDSRNAYLQYVAGDRLPPARARQRRRPRLRRGRWRTLRPPPRPHDHRARRPLHRHSAADELIVFVLFERDCYFFPAGSFVHWSTQSLTVFHQSSEFCGFSTQCPSSGKYSIFDGTPIRCSVVKS